MKRILLFIMAITFSLAPFAQKHSAQKKPVRKTAGPELAKEIEARGYDWIKAEVDEK